MAKYGYGWAQSSYHYDDVIRRLSYAPRMDGDPMIGYGFALFNVAGINIKKVIYHNPATIVYWSDGSKTVVKCGEHDIYDVEKGLAMAIVKKVCGNKGNYNKHVRRWLPGNDGVVDYDKII